MFCTCHLDQQRLQWRGAICLPPAQQEAKRSWQQSYRWLMVNPTDRRDGTLAGCCSGKWAPWFTTATFLKGMCVCICTPGEKYRNGFRMQMIDSGGSPANTRKEDRYCQTFPDDLWLPFRHIHRDEQGKFVSSFFTGKKYRWQEVYYDGRFFIRKCCISHWEIDKISERIFIITTFEFFL